MRIKKKTFRNNLLYYNDNVYEAILFSDSFSTGFRWVSDPKKNRKERWDFRQTLMNKPLFLGNNFSCIVKFLCLVDRPFLVVSCLKKNKRWDFTEQLWLKIAVRAQGAFFKLWPKSHQFLPNKSDSHCPRGGFRFKPIWNLTFYYSSEKKNKKDGCLRF